MNRKGHLEAISTTIAGPYAIEFYFWSYVKQHVHSVRVNGSGHLKERIREVVLRLIPDVLSHECEEWVYQLDVCSLLQCEYNHVILQSGPKVAIG